jgi:alkylation response protein AidB-like acyl-CoA dehydrogenase
MSRAVRDSGTGPAVADPFLTPERLELQAAARRFAVEEVLPVANELDAKKGDIPESLMRALAERGYFGILVDREHGGLGLGVFEYALVTEELARAWMSVASIIARANGMGTQVADADRRDELLRRSARGDWVGAAALSEPNAGSDLANVHCRAERDGDDYVVRGEKRWCGNALAADFILLLAKERDAAPGEPRSRGLVSLLIEKERGRFPAGLMGTPIDKIGYHGLTTYGLRFDGLRVPARNRIGSPEGGTGGRRAFRATMHGLNVARIHTAARAIEPAARSRTRSPTRPRASSSSGRSPRSRRSVSSSPTWRPRSRRRERSSTGWRAAATTASGSRRRRRW